MLYLKIEFSAVHLHLFWMHADLNETLVCVTVKNIYIYIYIILNSEKVHSRKMVHMLSSLLWNWRFRLRLLRMCPTSGYTTKWHSALRISSTDGSSLYYITGWWHVNFAFFKTLLWCPHQEFTEYYLVALGGDGRKYLEIPLVFVPSDLHHTIKVIQGEMSVTQTQDRDIRRWYHICCWIWH